MFVIKCASCIANISVSDVTPFVYNLEMLPSQVALYYTPHLLGSSSTHIFHMHIAYCTHMLRFDKQI